MQRVAACNPSSIESECRFEMPFRSEQHSGNQHRRTAAGRALSTREPVVRSTVGVLAVGQTRDAERAVKVNLGAGGSPDVAGCDAIDSIRDRQTCDITKHRGHEG